MKKIRLLLLTIFLTTAVPNKLHATSNKNHNLRHLVTGLLSLGLSIEPLRRGIHSKENRTMALLGVVLIGIGIYNFAQLKDGE